MKIFHLDESTVWGGAENQLTLLHRGLIDRGHESVVFCRPRSPLGERLQPIRAGTRAFRPRFEGDMLSALHLARTVRKEEPDIVHAHTSRSHAIARLAELVFPDFRLVVSRRVNYPIRRNGFSRLKYRFGVERYIAVSEAVKNTLVRGGVAAARVSVVYSCAGNAGQPVVRSARSGAFVVGFAGRLENNKRPLDAIEAVERLRKEGLNVTLRMAGGGGMKDRIAGEVQARGLREVVTLLGYQADLRQFFGDIDVLAFCSDGEGLPNVVLESMAAGVPAVAGRVGGVPEILDDGETGLLYPSGDVAALALALRKLIENPDIRSHIAEKAQRQVRSGFLPETMVEKTAGIYRELLEESHLPGA
ncbi:MAG: glycosyltransferase [Nitrospirae bacterium]|nr:glycosyltransferase [Nitrospirota bacterium]